MNTITVGVAARNEEKTITNNLASIIDAIKFTKRKNIRLVVCLNGCTDRTPQLVKTFLNNFSQGISFNIIYSDEGLINAQRTIVQKFSADVYVFSDADDIINVDSIELLLLELENDPKLIVAYAKTQPCINKENNSIFQKMGYLYDSQKLQTKRYYIHGRLFATRDWVFPQDIELVRRARQNRASRILLKYSRIKSLLSVDDIFLSSYIMNKYGLDAIRQVVRAYCFSWPAGSFTDWFRVYRRRNIEMEKMYRWFPEFNYLKPYLNRRTDWRKWLSAGIDDKILWIGLLCMRLIFFICLRVELFLLNFNKYTPIPQWQISSTTKKEFEKQN